MATLFEYTLVSHALLLFLPPTFVLARRRLFPCSQNCILSPSRSQAERAIRAWASDFYSSPATTDDIRPPTVGQKHILFDEGDDYPAKPLHAPPVHPMPHPTAARVKKRVRSTKLRNIPCRLPTDCTTIAVFVNMKPLPSHLCYRHRPHLWLTEQRRTTWWSTYFPTCV